MRKRIFDIFFSIIGLILLSPIFGLLALWIFIDTRGPIFFRQNRVGLNEEIFQIHKFRTMVHNAESLGGQLTVDSDSRITHSGQIMRKYKLDELPQLLDVISGRMSLVGPRPEVPKYVSFYPQDAKKIIFSVRPGLTDHASINFKDESIFFKKSSNAEQIYISEILPIKIKYYVQYVSNNSIWGDFKIILKTIKAILNKK
jgi:lipopolysaccharide/colanic/teichoic acid biosynthesis glycosyltransferase